MVENSDQAFAAPHAVCLLGLVGLFSELVSKRRVIKLASVEGTPQDLHPPVGVVETEPADIFPNEEALKGGGLGLPDVVSRSFPALSSPQSLSTYTAGNR